ncbi:MAG: antibiotic biosynthesis monooxygenase, partial [Mycobacterium sp.]
MFSVLFEVHPRSEEWETYLHHAKMLRPELEAIDGFVDNIRYRSLTRDGWVLSLSGWRDEKALVRWRTHAGHHDAQTQGRATVLLDYHLRVGQLTHDSAPPPNYHLSEQRLDQTETGEATTIALIDVQDANTDDPTALAHRLGLDEAAPGLVGWDVFNAVLTPGDVILLLAWRELAYAEAFRKQVEPPPQARFRQVRVIRDYALLDRHEAPQFYPAPQWCQSATE